MRQSVSKLKVEPSARVTFTLTVWRGVRSATPVMVNWSSPVRPSVSRVWPSTNCNGSTPMPTRFERWIRSKLSTITARTPSKFVPRSEEHTSELQSLMRISYAVCCLKKKNKNTDEQQLNVSNILTNKK